MSTKKWVERPPKTLTSTAGKTYNTDESATKPVSGSLAVPFRDVSSMESITLGFRSQMLEVGPGKVLTTSGFGGEFIILEWEDKTVAIRGSELLAAWVGTFAPKDAKAIMQAASKMYARKK